MAVTFPAATSPAGRSGVPRWAKVGAVVAVVVVWLFGLLLTVGLLATLHGRWSPACPYPGADSDYGTGEISWVPLGIRCTYPAADAPDGRALPDGPGPGVGHLLAELYLVAVPVVGAAWLVRRRSPRTSYLPAP